MVKVKYRRHTNNSTMKKIFNLLFVGGALLTFKFGIWLLLSGTFFTIYAPDGFDKAWAFWPGVVTLVFTAISIVSTVIYLFRKER